MAVTCTTHEVHVTASDQTGRRAGMDRQHTCMTPHSSASIMDSCVNRAVPSVAISATAALERSDTWPRGSKWFKWESKRYAGEELVASSAGVRTTGEQGTYHSYWPHRQLRRGAEPRIRKQCEYGRVQAVNRRYASQLRVGHPLCASHSDATNTRPVRDGSPAHNTTAAGPKAQETNAPAGSGRLR